MARTFERRDQCCLCGKTKEQVKKLIVGLHGAVCSDCIDLCNDILHNEPEKPGPGASVPDAIVRPHLASPFRSVPKPQEIVAFLDNYVVGQSFAKKSAFCCRLQPLQEDRRAYRRRRRAIQEQHPHGPPPPAPARRFSPRPWPECSTCPSRSRTPPLSRRPAT